MGGMLEARSLPRSRGRVRVGGLLDQIQELVEDSLVVLRTWRAFGMVLDGEARERWWDERYPALVRPERRTRLFGRIVRFPVGVYVIPAER